MNWTSEMEEQARSLWLSGTSATKIGEIMGLSRNSIMSKVSRLGVVRPGEKNALKKIAQRSIPTAPMRSPYSEPGGTTFEEIKRGQCYFSISPHEASPHLFCGAPVIEGSLYCEKHHHICYVRKKDE